MTKKEILLKIKSIQNELFLLEKEKKAIIEEIGVDAFIDEVLNRYELLRYYERLIYN